MAATALLVSRDVIPRDLETLLLSSAVSYPGINFLFCEIW